MSHGARREGAPGGAAARVGSARSRCAGSAVVAVRTESGGRRKVRVGSLTEGSHMSAREEERRGLCWRKLGRLLGYPKRGEKKREEDFGLLAH